VKPVRAKDLISCHSAVVRFLRTLCETLKSTIAKRQNLRHAKSPTNQLCPSLPYANPFEWAQLGSNSRPVRIASFDA
jgi:hypothetical protein